MVNEMGFVSCSVLLETTTKVRMKKKNKKTSVCTGTRGGSEPSLNTVVQENVKVYMNQYLKFFVKFS